MRRTATTLAALACLIVGSLLLPSVANAASDTTPPTLASLSLSASSVDTSASAQTITFTARITDDLSGLADGYDGYVDIRGPSSQSIWVELNSSDRVSGTALDGTYEFDVTVPRYAEQGTWTIYWFTFSDRARNLRFLRAADLSAAGFPSAFTQTGVGDGTPPTVKSFSVSPTSVDTSASAQTVTFTAEIADDLAGFDRGYLQFESPSNQGFYASFDSSDRVSGTALDGVYESGFTLPRYSEQGTWEIVDSEFYDQAANVEYSWPVGFPSTFTQTGAGDTTPPTLESVSISPRTVDTSSNVQTITFTARITDDLAGVDRGVFEFLSPSKIQYVDAYFDSSKRVSGTALDGTYVDTVTVPRYAEQGTWTVDWILFVDEVENYLTPTAADLSAAGFPTTFFNVPNPAPVIGSFTPTSGPVGTSVTIWGSDFSDASAVRFNGTGAAFSVASNTMITAVVPTGATTGPISVTAPGGTATSAVSFIVTGLVPTITSFTPTSGEVGTQVVVTGTNLTGATQVTFGGVATTSMRVDSATKITATVPPYAVTGPIVVTAPGGTATSSAVFTVIALSHGRKVSLHLPGAKANGTVSVKDQVNACAANVPVKVQHLVNGTWRNEASLKTNASGDFHVGGMTTVGRYRAVAKRVTLGGTDICEKAISPTVRQ